MIQILLLNLDFGNSGYTFCEILEGFPNNSSLDFSILFKELDILLILVFDVLLKYELFNQTNGNN